MKFALLLLIASAAVCQDTRPFSHELHLKLPAKFTCLSCHSSVQSSTRLEDNNLPQTAACLGCHKEVNIKPRESGLLARFNHQKHLSFGNVARVIRSAIDSKTYLSPVGDIRRHLDSANACLACHRGMEQSTALAKTDFPQMADCLVCHNKIEPPFSCEQCHDKGAAIKPATHTPDFIDAHHGKNMKLDKSTCAVCHGRKFTCLGCH